MAVFDFPYFTIEGENPETGFSGQFGGSYVFATPPTDPDQRTFTLNFTGMQYMFNNLNQLDSAVKPERNMLRLLEFYAEHKLWKSFSFTHPVHGLMAVKFKKPCPEPEGIKGGNGVVKDFSIILIEQP